MFVTAELLKKLKACGDQRRKFVLLFSFGVELPRAVIVQHAQEIAIASAAGSAAYRQAVEPALAAYKLACATAFADITAL